MCRCPTGTTGMQFWRAQIERDGELVSVLVLVSCEHTWPKLY